MLNKDRRNSILLNTEKLNALNPLSVLLRGYSVVEHDGAIVNKTADVAVGDCVDVRLTDGVFSAAVQKVTKKRKNK